MRSTVRIWELASTRLLVRIFWNLQTNHFITSRDVWFDEEFRLVVESASGWNFEDPLIDAPSTKDIFMNEHSDIALAYQSYVHSFNTALVEADAKEISAQVVSSPIPSSRGISSSLQQPGDTLSTINEFQSQVLRERKGEAKVMTDLAR